jgi:hypothetical protein
MANFVIYALVGKIIIFLLQKFPKHPLPIIGKLFREGKFLDELFGCDLCLGFWVYSGLAFLFDVNIIGEIFYVPVLSEFIIGAITTFVVHIFSVGWNSKFQNIIVE